QLVSTLDQTSATTVSPHSPPPSAPPLLSTFRPATPAEVRSIILSSSYATFSLDFIPTRLLKSCINSLIQPITTIVNLCLAEGIFPDDFKRAIVTPLHKKHSLPHEELSSYRPISNLNFISKTLERIIHSRLTNHLESFPALCPYQSAYRQYHSTETALLRIYNDALLYLLVFLRDLSYDHFCSAFIHPHSATFLQTLLFPFIYMLMILSCIFHFQVQILYQILTLCLPLLTPFILGFLLTVFLLILPKLNIYF